MTQQSAITVEIDADGIGLVTIDQAGRAMNVLNPDLMTPFAAVVDRLEKEDAIKGLVLTSGKSTFIVGADIDQLTAIKSPEEAFRLCEDMKALLRR
ncbi:MAG: 3-hydroxyacyl-CoA dehydrogenase, partial [Rhodanobacter sp.]